MANEKFTQLPTVVSANAADIIAVVQGGVSSQETLGQVQTLMQSGLVQSYPGNPNGFVAGTTYGFCWDTTGLILYVCTVSGNAATAVWTVAGSVTFPLAVALGGTGLNAAANSAVLASTAAGVPIWRALTAGQVIIGSAAGAPLAATLSAGPGVSIANGNNTITISGTGSGIGWTEVTGTTQAVTADNGYVVNNAGLVTLTLPLTAAFGTVVSVVGKGTGGWLIAQNAGQNIQLGSSSATVGVGGSIASTNRFDSIDLICTTANTTWTTLGAPQGNITIV